jgi:hypothetical protein
MKSIVGEKSWFIIPEPDDVLADDNLDPQVFRQTRQLLSHAIGVCLGMNGIEVQLREEDLPDPDNPSEVVSAIEVVVTANGTELQLPFQQAQDALAIPAQTYRPSMQLSEAV